jgi:hypothetical protein
MPVSHRHMAVQLLSSHKLYPAGGHSPIILPRNLLVNSMSSFLGLGRLSPKASASCPYAHSGSLTPPEMPFRSGKWRLLSVAPQWARGGFTDLARDVVR